jgi:hypothetical protein
MLRGANMGGLCDGELYILLYATMLFMFPLPADYVFTVT